MMAEGRGMELAVRWIAIYLSGVCVRQRKTLEWIKSKNKGETNNEWKRKLLSLNWMGRNQLVSCLVWRYICAHVSRADVIT